MVRRKNKETQYRKIWSAGFTHLLPGRRVEGRNRHPMELRGFEGLTIQGGMTSSA